MATPRKSAPQSAKRAAIEADVLRATEELLQEGHTWADLNIERIATRAGISRTAFYFYFRDKRELLMRLTEDVTELLYATASTWWAGDGPRLEELRSALDRIQALYAEHFTLLRAIVEVSTYDEEVARFWRSLVNRFVDATERRIAGEQASGRAEASIPARATAFALVWGTERSYYQQIAQEEPMPAGELVEALTGLWLRSVYGRA